MMGVTRVGIRDAHYCTREQKRMLPPPLLASMLVDSLIPLYTLTTQSAARKCANLGDKRGPCNLNCLRLATVEGLLKTIKFISVIY